jgi:hypothetical protein
MLVVVALLAFAPAACLPSRLWERSDAPPLPATRPTPTPVAAAPPVPAEALAQLSTEEQLATVVAPVRDLTDLTLRLRPEAGPIERAATAPPPDYRIGDRSDFTVRNVDTTANATVSAELFYKSDVLYGWVEAGQEYDTDALRDSLDRFSEHIYPTLVAAFGSEPNPGVDNDPRLHVLHTTGMGSGVAGYFSGADTNPRAAFPLSNEKEMFNISLEWLNRANDYPEYETVLAHEFQHMIHWAVDGNEEAWLNEGLSEYAQEVVGYSPDVGFPYAFAAQPDTQLNTWQMAGGNAAHYGGAYRFVRYLVDRFGPEIAGQLVAEPANGVGGVQRVLERVAPGTRFEEVFGDWVVANFADQPQAAAGNGRYGFAAIDPGQVQIDQIVALEPGARLTSTVANLAADYFRVAGPGDLAVDFRGATVTRLAAADAHGGSRVAGANRVDNSDTRLTHTLDLRAVDASTPVTMSVAMWWDIEEGYDFGYVMASRDGAQWDLLEGQRTTRANVTGNNLGAGYTGMSTEGDDGAGPAWVTETFDLDSYRGGEVQIRFEYVTDDAMNNPGWLIDDVSIPAIGLHEGFERGAPGWLSEGWLVTDNALEQRWLVQVLQYEGTELVGVERPALTDGRASFTLQDVRPGRTAVIAVSGMTPFTTEAAEYSLTATP